MAKNQKTDYSSQIKFEEELMVIRNGAEPMSRRINKTPYLEHNGYKIYISRNEYEQIMAGKLNPETITSSITEELTCKYWL